MQAKEALKIADKLVLSHTGKSLTEIQRLIFEGAWKGKTYEEVAIESGYQPNYIRQDAGPKLWRLLSTVLGERIGKTYLHAVFLSLDQESNVEEKLMPYQPNIICNRDVFVLLDQSGSMTKPDTEGKLKRWDSLREQVMSHVDRIVSYNVDGENICSSIKIFLFSKKRVKDEYFTVNNVSQVENIFLENRPDSTTFVEPTLNSCLEEWFKQRTESKTQGALFIIYTDGQFDDTVDFENLVKRTCAKLDNQNIIKIFIIGVGKDIDEEYFQKLDNNLKTNVDRHNNSCDIVGFSLANEIDDIIEMIDKEFRQ
jgi:von Willebrand factor type A domain